MAQKVTESVKGMDQGMETVAEVGKGLEGGAFQSSVSRGTVARAQGSGVSSRPMRAGMIFWTSCSTVRIPWSFGGSPTR